METGSRRAAGDTGTPSARGEELDDAPACRELVERCRGRAADRVPWERARGPVSPRVLSSRGRAHRAGSPRSGSSPLVIAKSRAPSMSRRGVSPELSGSRTRRFRRGTPPRPAPAFEPCSRARSSQRSETPRPSSGETVMTSRLRSTPLDVDSASPASRGDGRCRGSFEVASSRRSPSRAHRAGRAVGATASRGEMPRAVATATRSTECDDTEGGRR